MQRQNEGNGFVALGANGATVVIEPTSRDRAREIARADPRLNDTHLVGLVDLEQLGRSFGSLAQELEISNRRQLNQLMEVLSVPTDDLSEALADRLANYGHEPMEAPSIEPFEINDDAILNLPSLKAARWHGDPERDRDTIFQVFNEAHRADAIIEPTVDGHKVILGLMLITAHPAQIDQDLFVRMFVPGIEHIVGDVLPLEGRGFLEHAAEVAGTEEGSSYGKALLTMVLFQATAIYSGLEPMLTNEEKQAAGLVDSNGSKA